MSEQQAIADALNKIAQAVDVRADMAALTASIKAHLGAQAITNQRLEQMVKKLSDTAADHEARLCVAEQQLSGLKGLPTSHAEVRTKVGVISATAAVVGGTIMSLVNWAITTFGGPK